MKAAVKRYCIEGYDILKNRNMQTALKKNQFEERQQEYSA